MGNCNISACNFKKEVCCKECSKSKSCEWTCAWFGNGRDADECEDYVQADIPTDLSDTEVEIKAEENLKKWQEWLGKVQKASDEAGITLEQGLKFIDASIKYIIE